MLNNSMRIIMLLGITGLYLAIPNARPDFTIFNCHDSENYLALADNLAHGRGYTRALPPAPYLPHTTWPPGTPALLVPAVALSGSTINWFLVKWTMCLMGLAGVILTWFFLRRVSGSLLVADIGALSIAANPFYWDFSHQAMAELPLTVWLIGGMLLVDWVWAGRKVLAWEAAVSGLACGVSMLFKGHGAALMLVPLVYLTGQRRFALPLKPGIVRWLLYAGGFVVPQLLWTIRRQWVIATGFDGIDQFRMVFASLPNDSSSRLRSFHEVGATVLQNLRYYASYRIPSQILPGFWIDYLWDWKGSGFVAITLTLMVLLLALPRRPGAWPPCVIALPMAILNLVYAFGGSGRFWMPVTTMLTIAIIANHVPRLLGLQPRTRRLGIATIAIVLLVNIVSYVIDHEKHPYAKSNSWSQLAQLFEEIAARDDLHLGAVLTQTGNYLAFQLMTGFPAPLPASNENYDHVIIKNNVKMPPGSRIVHTVEPWLLITLERPMSWQQINEFVPIEDGTLPPTRKQ